MRSFNEIAQVVKENRVVIDGLSQSNLSYHLGYKNGQLISNTERGKCSLPVKSAKKACELLKIPEEVMVKAYMKDYETYVRSYIGKVV